MNKILKINDKDDVVVCLSDVKAGEVIETGNDSVIALSDIPAGHKMALHDINEGDVIIKYGYAIGSAKAFIKKGEHIHTHNLKTGLAEEFEYEYDPVNIDNSKAEKIASGLRQTFKGYMRKSGRVGVRNEIWIIPTVGCVNNIATKVAELSNRELCKGVDEVIAFPHPYGCSQMGDDQEHTRVVLADLITHPNAGGVLVLGLGCENSNIDVLKPYIGEYDPERVKFLVCQESEDEISDAILMVRELMKAASGDERVDIPVSELIIGMKCGGSDGFSGITANPLVGRFSDLCIAKGGTTILTEVPEMFGAETILMNRCENEKLYDKTVCLINDFKEYFKSNGQTVYENPSPGNKKGGISTLEDKSLGCTQKSGSTAVKGVLNYGEKVTEKGLNLLSAPGNDLVASTALAASGAQIVLFTTGRGTPFASPVPTVKISSNSKLADHKKNWIDFNAGEILEKDNMDDLAVKLYEYVLKIAEGKRVASERAGFHDMAIFKQGVTL